MMALRERVVQLHQAGGLPRLLVSHRAPTHDRQIGVCGHPFQIDHSVSWLTFITSLGTSFPHWQSTPTVRGKHWTRAP